MKNPNVLFIFTDDQRFDTISALGNPEIDTPNLDRLVKQGTTFTHAHIMGGTSAAVCMPSRAMLHTGRTLFRLHGSGETIPVAHKMLGGVLQEQGYDCFGTGKWHNGRESFARSFNCGAEIFFGGMDDHWNVPAYDFDPSGSYESRFPVIEDPKSDNAVTWRHCDHIHLGRHSSELFSDAVIRFLAGRNADKPFFAYVSYMAPHDPRTMPERFLKMYDPEKQELPENFLGGHPFDNGSLQIRDECLAQFPRDPGEVRRHIAEYYAMITHLDFEVGRVLEELERQGLSKETIVVFAGDNGLALGQHGLMGKQNLYDHSVRVPLIFAGPGVPKDQKTDAWCYLLDIFPTLCDLTGLPTPETVEGMSLLPAIQEPSTVVRDSLHFAYKGVQRAVRRGRHKLIEYVVSEERTTQLFDLQSDPCETMSLASEPEHAEILESLRRELRRWPTDFGDNQEMGNQFWSAY